MTPWHFFLQYGIVIQMAYFWITIKTNKNITL